MMYRWYAIVDRVEEKQLTVGGKHDAAGNAELIVESAGWWISFGGISIYLGPEPPAFQPGDRIRLTLEHSQEAS